MSSYLPGYRAVRHSLTLLFTLVYMHLHNLMQVIESCALVVHYVVQLVHTWP